MTQLIAGAGAVASVGEGVGALFGALCAGTSGLAGLRGFDAARYRVRHAYEIDDRPPGGGDVPGRATAWLLRAVAEAAAQAGLGDDLADVPVLVGTGLRELRSAELAWRDGVPFDAARQHFGTALRERFGAQRTYTFSGACSASLYALAMGADMVEGGMADTVVVAGVDTLTESMHGLLDRVNSEPPRQVRPFDRARRGVLMGDGAAAVVLRREEPGAAGSALGRLRSVGVNCDARHVTAPDPQGIAAAMRDAQRRAGVKPCDIDLVLLHGTGTLLNDGAEAAALGRVFGRHVRGPLMTALKSMTGHTSGGSGLLSLIVALRALSSGRVPPVVGLADPAREAAAFRFAREPVAGADLRVAQIDAFGFGGVNAVAIVERTGGHRFGHPGRVTSGGERATGGGQATGGGRTAADAGRAGHR
ncbi:beta-ketoacyl synthase N-terminal-like domain-containing protein [Streptomyces sp. B1866]|uniref:beta-ketoacyl-[acyl-carrier-protein] synthase family protein n=1 Tax=Streptomyces sp. B1866 TaxID=3075431 RepID=UPI00288EF339|nr:beta-ketoacyl synthase N-terminal-like domain-containing protein [Streptomyces sp. B1866]MDT3399848.1 beta-ketoacyl synthase N-terminal-like domain-containing protein [Streptomyces sp. B1866]